MMGMLICLAAIAVLQWFVPYWGWIMVVPFVYGLLKPRRFRQAFAVGAASAGTLWLVMSLYQGLSQSDLIARRVAAMLSVGSPAWVIVITTLFAILAAGFAGGTGYLLKGAFVPQVSQKA